MFLRCVVDEHRVCVTGLLHYSEPFAFIVGLIRLRGRDSGLRSLVGSIFHDTRLVEIVLQVALVGVVERERTLTVGRLLQVLDCEFDDVREERIEP
jgi:hypothetical protein